MNSFTGGLRFGINVQVTDETGLTDKKTFRVNVADVPAGTPVLQAIGDRAIREFELLTIQLSATDSNSDQSQLRYSALRDPTNQRLIWLTSISSTMHLKSPVGHRWQFSGSYNGLNRATDSLFSQIELTNVGQVAVSGRMLAVFGNSSGEQVSLIQPEGRLPDGRFFIELDTENGMLAAGETTWLRDLIISNPDSELFDFDLTILAEVNSAPTRFTSIPPSEMEAGRTLRYTAVAVDPDERQQLTYSVVVGHENISIDEVTGELTWVTTVDEIGSHAVTLRATDPFGLFVDQSFSIDVQDSLQNRPPIFTTQPVTDATASSGFEITSIATGNNPAGVGVVSGFQGRGSSRSTATTRRWACMREAATIVLTTRRLTRLASPSEPATLFKAATTSMLACLPS